MCLGCTLEVGHSRVQNTYENNIPVLSPPLSLPPFSLSLTHSLSISLLLENAFTHILKCLCKVWGSVVCCMIIYQCFKHSFKKGVHL
jgi:hypothetical protein